MTVQELRDLLIRYPDDAIVVTRATLGPDHGIELRTKAGVITEVGLNRIFFPDDLNQHCTFNPTTDTKAVFIGPK